MTNKTCGECRYMLHKDTFEVCTHSMTKTSMFDKACKHFAPPTNSDVIRKMGNGAFAFMITRLILDGCPISKSKTMHDCEVSNDCTNCLKQWLNAPADCVKQNGNHDTQADLCKADNTESEVEK